jgi:hypothetical protein
VTKQSLKEEREICSKLHKADRKEEEAWCLKYRSLWLKFGDKNTSLFHKHAKVRSQRYIVKEIRNEDGKRLT